MMFYPVPLKRAFFQNAATVCSKGSFVADALKMVEPALDSLVNTPRSIPKLIAVFLKF